MPQISSLVYAYFAFFLPFVNKKLKRINKNLLSQFHLQMRSTDKKNWHFLPKSKNAFFENNFFSIDFCCSEWFSAHCIFLCPHFGMTRFACCPSTHLPRVFQWTKRQMHCKFISSNKFDFFRSQKSFQTHWKMVLLVCLSYYMVFV